MSRTCRGHGWRAGSPNKAARGEPRTDLPVGLVWGETDGETRLHPDEAVTDVVQAVFDQFAVSGSVRATWLWSRDNDLRWPWQPIGYRRDRLPEITWVEPTHHAVHTTLTHPAHAGAHVYGRTRQDHHLADNGRLRVRRRKLPQDEWEVCVTEHHPGFIDWDTHRANQARIGVNIRPERHQPGTGAVREGAALSRGLATRGDRGRKLAVFYRGPSKSTPGYYRDGTGELVDGKGVRHLNVGGQVIDAAVAEAFLAALSPAAVRACLAAAERLEAGYDTALDQYRRQVEHARYAALKAERRYRAVDPENRLVARGLEAEWNTTSQQVADAETELGRRETTRPKTLTPQEKQAILALGDDLGSVWSAPTTNDRDRKQLLRTLLEEVQIAVHRDDADPHADPHADPLPRFNGGVLSELTVPPRRPRPNIRTDEDTLALPRRLAVHYPDTKIAGILNRQHRRTARGLPFTASRVQSPRHHHKIPRYQPNTTTHEPEGELLTVSAAARTLGIAPSTLLRWLDDGFVAGEQITPGAPWRIRLTDEIRGMVVNDAPEGWLALHHASRALGVCRQTVLRKVKRGELRAVLTHTGRRKCLRIQVPTPQDTLFETPTISEGAV